MHRLPILPFLWVFLCVVVSEASAQDVAAIASLASETAQATSSGIPGSHVLSIRERAVRELLRTNPSLIEQARLRKASSWGFTVGSEKSWYADDLTSSDPNPNNSRYLVPSTCRAVGKHCYIFVSDSSWTSGLVNQAVVDSVRTVFDVRTPADPAHGIYETDVQVFGSPPDVDSDSLIIILLLDIRDGWSGSGAYVAGYFFGFNEIPKSTPGYSTSNEAEIYFLDCKPQALTTHSGLQVGMATTAHEFQHMIHFFHDPQEITFIDESFSLTAEIYCGYPIFDPQRYVNETNHTLFDWRRGSDLVLNDYSRAARFGVYLHDQFGKAVFRDIVASPLHGIEGIDAGLAASGTSRRFADIFVDWEAANIVDNPAVNTRYAYTYPGLPRAVGPVFLNPNVPQTTELLDNLAARFLTFRGGSDLKVTLTANDPSVLIKGVETGPSSERVLDVTPGAEFAEPAFGSTYTEVSFVVINTSRSNQATYSYQSSGTGASFAEMKWDSTEPIGYLQLTTGDTICVTFDGVQGARLDSVRVALRRAGTVVGGVWGYIGSLRPTPLGRRLAVPVNASTSATPPVPYPVPWPNWSTIDLRAYAIDASSPFAVGFVVAGDNNTAPRVMSTPYPSAGPYHSFTYLHAPEGGTPDWYYLTKSTDTVWLYLIRAYVSFTGGPPVELVPPPFALEQNYPNPFNPGTWIRYSLPERAFVTLKVYNVLGQELETLVSGTQDPGKKEVFWRPSNLPSGAYVYRLQTGSAVASRKLLFIK